MQILLSHKDIFQNRPPVISSLLILSDLGHKVYLLTEGINPFWQKELTKRGVEVFVASNRWSGKCGIIGKIMSYLSYRKKFYSLIHRLFPHGNEGILWIEGAPALVAIGASLKHYHYILQIQELHEKHKYQLNAISKVIRQALCVFMPEYNRTVLYQCWFSLTKRPIVLPNKPYFLPNEAQLNSLKEKYRDRLEIFETKKVILYQGNIGRDRDLTAFLKAVATMPEFCFVFLGNDCGMLEHYRKVNPHLIYLGFIPAPEYLVFTSLCYIGIVSYDANVLNNAYCAPNKIYEYSAFGKPMIGNDIPGLKEIEVCGAACLVDETDSASISNAISLISFQYEKYSDASRSFFKKTDNKQIVETALRNIK